VGVEQCNWSGSANTDGAADIDELQAAVQRLEKQMPKTNGSLGPLDDDRVAENTDDNEEAEEDDEEDNNDESDDDGDETDEEQEDEQIFFGIASTKPAGYSQLPAQEIEADNLNATIQEAHRSFVEATKEADRYATEAVEAEKRMLDESVAWEEAQHKSTVAFEECRRLSMEARDEAVARSKKEAAEARAAKREAAMFKAKEEAEAAEKRAKEIEERRKKMADEKRKAADAAEAARKRATEAADKEKALRKQQDQRVKDLRSAEAASTKLAADKQQLISQLERRLQSKITGCPGSGANRFIGILKVFGIPCDNTEQATVQKAYRKALIKYHPDKAQRKGEGWQKVVESEEIYKLVQNEWQKVRKRGFKDGIVDHSYIHSSIICTAPFTICLWSFTVELTTLACVLVVVCLHSTRRIRGFVFFVSTEGTGKVTTAPPAAAAAAPQSAPAPAPSSAAAACAVTTGTGTAPAALPTLCSAGTSTRTGQSIRWTNLEMPCLYQGKPL
jgi:chemotaxis protein histidine kinase CheA